MQDSFHKRWGSFDVFVVPKVQQYLSRSLWRVSFDDRRGSFHIRYDNIAVGLFCESLLTIDRAIFTYAGLHAHDVGSFHNRSGCFHKRSGSVHKRRGSFLKRWGSFRIIQGSFHTM